jgi:Bacterial Ig-like domain (group 1)
MISKKKIILSGVGFLVGIVLVFYFGSFIVPKVLVTLNSRASSTQKMSVKNSFLLGEKILARADGKDKCVVNVFVLDAKGKGVFGKQVQLNGLGSLDAVSDNFGKATFELTSTMTNQYELVASVNGIPLGKTIKVTFRD